MTAPRTPHALILPYPAQGHIVPLMQLSYSLIERGVRITFINTHFNHNRIFAAKATGEAAFAGEEIDGINFVAIPDGLEPEDERQNFGGLTESLMKVMPGFLEELIRDKAGEFTGFVADANMAWALKIGRDLGLRTAALWPAAAGILDALFSIPELIQNGVIGEHGALMKKEVIQLNQGMTPLDSTNLPWHFFNDAYTEKILFKYFIANNQATSNAEMMICNSFEEIERPIFSKIQHVLPVGPLHLKLESIGDLNLCQFWPEDKQCIAWLDKQPKNSVIYVAFGSTGIFDDKQFQELALGLELTGRPFLWVVRPNLTNNSINCTYPSGFEKRVADRGRMIGWSPQHKVLKHPAIACFVSHCGWNSIIEGLRNGVPFLSFPYFGDQLYNQRCITDVWKVGLNLTRDENGLVSKEEVRSKVEELLKNTNIITKSQIMKQLAGSCIMEGGSSFKNLNKFAEFIRDSSQGGSKVGLNS